MIELAFVISTLILGTLGLMDVSRFIWVYNEIEAPLFPIMKEVMGGRMFPTTIAGLEGAMRLLAK